jgi:hypothetical protein
VKWQVVYTTFGSNSISGIFQLFNSKGVHSYDLYIANAGYKLGFQEYYVAYIRDLGASTDLNSTYPGPVPYQNLITAITALPGVNVADPWTGQNGWEIIKHVQESL